MTVEKLAAILATRLPPRPARRPRAGRQPLWRASACGQGDGVDGAVVVLPHASLLGAPVPRFFCSSHPTFRRPRSPVFFLSLLLSPIGHHQGIVNLMAIVELFLLNSVGKWGTGPNFARRNSP